MNPYPKLLLVCLLPVLVFTSCLQRAYYQSPLTGSIPAYHAMPVGSDSLKSATYASATVTLGGMNERSRDNVFAFQAGLHHAVLINRVRVFGGASLGVGTYHVKPYFYYDNYYTDTVSINKNAGTKFWGAYGAYGGISLSAPMGRRGEWRYIGIEGSLFNEFGDYYTFRKNLPDSAATTNDKKKYMGSVGISTEFIFKRRSQNKFGMKFAFGSYLRSLQYYNGYNTYPGNYYYRQKDNLLYFSSTYHFTIRKATTSFQVNFASHAATVQFGLNYRL